MSLPRFAVVIATLLTVAPAAAQTPAAAAPSPYDLFRRVCVDTAAEMGRVVASPDLAGWINMPFPIAPKIEHGRLIEKTLRIKHEGRDRMTVVFAGRGELNANGRKVPFVNCSIAFKPGVLAPTRQHIETWLGFAPQQLPKGVVGFRYSERGGVRTPIRTAKLSDIPAAPAGSRVAAIDLKAEKNTLVVSYTLPRL